jgi:hypothetical protein
VNVVDVFRFKMSLNESWSSWISINLLGGSSLDYRFGDSGLDDRFRDSSYR